MTEKEFLEKRVPFWLEGENLTITIPNNNDKLVPHSNLCKKYGYNYIYAIRGYYWPGSHVMIYSCDYETPNITILAVQYLFEFFKDAKWIGIGCHKGKIGELWKPKLILLRDNDLLNIKSEESVQD